MHWILSRKPHKAVTFETFPLRIHKTKFTKSKWYDNAMQCHSTYIPDIFKIFAKFFLLFTCCFLLSESPSVHFLWCGLVSIHVYWFLCSRSLALWLSGPGCLFLLCACSCPPAFRSLCSCLDLPAWFWFPSSPGWWSGGVVLMQCEWFFYCDQLSLSD